LKSSSSNIKIIAVIVVAIFLLVIDINTELGVSSGINYVLLVLMSFLFVQPTKVILLAFISTILIFLGWYLSPSGGEFWKICLNRSYSLIAVWSVSIVLFNFLKSRINLNNQKNKSELLSTELKQQLDTLNAAAIVSITDKEGNIIFVNEMFCNISKYSKEELIGNNHRMLKSHFHSDGLFIGMWAAISKGKVWKGEICNIAKDGTTYWVATTISPFTNEKGEVEKYVSVRFDITHQKEQEIMLLEQTKQLKIGHQTIEELNKERFTKLIEHSSDITCIIDKMGKMNFVSPSITRIMGYSKNELLGSNVFDYIHPNDVQLARDNFFINYKKSDEDEYNVYRFKTNKGEYKFLRTMHSLHFDTANINGIIINAQDITKLIEFENENKIAIIKAEERERQRISQDLHDGLGQKISAADMYVNSLNEEFKNQLDEETYNVFQMGKKMLNEAANEARLMSYNIMPPSLLQYGLDGAIGGLIKNYQFVNDKMKFHYKSNIEGKRFDENIELAIFRTVQELVNNSIKHAQASLVEISLNRVENELKIKVTDDGVGFVENSKLGLGLLSISQRADVLGGTSSFKSETSKGAQVSVSFPI